MSECLRCRHTRHDAMPCMANVTTAADLATNSIRFCGCDDGLRMGTELLDHLDGGRARGVGEGAS